MTTNRICNVPDCSNAAHSRGWCSNHYYRWHRYGSPEKTLTRPRNRPFKPWFWAQVQKSRGPLETECLVWGKGLDSEGYGFVSVQGIKTRAHRVAWQLKCGTEPEGQLNHKCHVRKCVNPDHLEVAPQASTMKDMVNAGRSAKGTHHAGTRLTEADVLEARRLRREGWPFSRLSEKYQVGISTLAHAVTGRNWKHLPGAVKDGIRRG